MSLDLGPLSLTLQADTTDFDRKIDQAIAGLDKVTRAGEKATGVKLDVSPKGVRELDGAAASADGLSRNLDKAAGSVGKIQPPTAATKGLTDAAGAADTLGKGLGDAASAAGQIKAPTGVASTLDKAAGSAGNLADQLGRAGAEAQELGSATSSIGGMEGAMGGLLSTAKSLAPALTGAAAAGTILTKGWDRLTAIDSATFKLQGLGHETESVAGIMQSSLDSVSGTAFGLGEAASAAANAVASGIKPGSELTQVLTTIADTAAISGASMGDMGMIFNSVMAKGKLQGDDLLQLMGRGVPVLQMIGEELGVTAAEVSELATEGAISFEIFESAMRNGLGGAAKEMGGSIEGAMMNAGAAVGRLGESIMKVVSSEGPSAIAGFTEGVDLMTAGVKAAYGAWEQVPGPIKTVASVLLAAQVAQKLLNTELATGMRLKVADGVTSATTSISNFGSSLREAYGYTRAANPEMGVLSAGMTTLAGSGGVAATAMGGLKGAAGGLLSALGGPWGIALGGATIALGAYMSHVQKTKQAQQEAEAATESWANVLTTADGKITEAVTNQAVSVVQNAKWADSLENVGLTAGEAAAAILDLDGSYEDQIASLDRLILANSDYSKLRGQERDDARNYVADLRNVRDGIIEQAESYNQGADAAREAGDANTDLARKLADSHRAAEQAAGPFDTLNGVLDTTGDKAKTVDDAIANLAQRMMGLSDDPALRLQSYLGTAAEDLDKLKETLGEGSGGFDVSTGLFDEWTEQGRSLHDTVSTLKTSMYEAAAAQYELAMQQGSTGVEAAAAAADTANGYTDALRAQLEQAGWTVPMIDSLIDTYGLVPGEIMTNIEVAGLETANALIQGLDERLTHVDTETYTITVDADAISLTKEEAEELGYAWEDIGNNTIQLKAENATAMNAIEDLAARTEHLNTDDNTIVFRADMADVTEAFNEAHNIKAELVTNPAELYVVADTAEARAGIEELNLKATEMPDGNLFIHSNSPEEMQKLLDLGAKTEALPEGFIEITDTSKESMTRLENLGVTVTRLPNGKVVITDNADAVARQIDLKLNGKTTKGYHEIWERYYSSGRTTSTGGTSVGQHYRSNGGQIPHLAAGGDTHGGYRLPTTGPGTSTTDGILGLDSRGIPTAWVDRGEYVTNREATAKYLNTLAAINRDDPTAIINAIMGDLPMLNTGGILPASEIKNRLGHMNNGRYVMGGFSEGATDCSGGVAAVVNTALGLPTFDSRMSTVTQGDWLANKGFQPGRGDNNDIVVGWYDYGGGVYGHTSLRLQDGTFVESGGNTGQGFTIGGKAGGLDGRGYTHFMHLPWEPGGAFPADDGSGDFLTGDGGARTSMGTSVDYRAEFEGIDIQDGKSGVGSTFGGSFNVPGLASNASRTVGQSLGGAAGQISGAAGRAGYAGEANALMNMRNPFAGEGTWRGLLGDPTAAQIMDVARQLEAELGQGGIAAQVEAALDMNTPNWDVWLRVSPETIEAFNQLGEAKADRENATYAVTDAERDLADARKHLTEVTSEGVELSTSATRKIEDAEEALAKARDEGKADKIADAEKKLTRAREDAAAELEKAGAKNTEEIVKANEQVAKATSKLTQEREKEQRAIADLQKAHQDYQIAMAIAPINALMELADGVVAGTRAMAEAFSRLDDVIQSTNAVLVRHQEAQVASAQATLSAVGAEQSLVRQERTARNQRKQDILTVQQAEWDLAMARHDASKVAGAAEVDLAQVRQSGIYEVMQTSVQADQRAIMSAQNIAMMEAALAVAKAEQAYREQQSAYDSQIAMIELEFAQREAELQAGYLSIATMELAAIQGEAAGIAGYGASALAKKTEGTEKKQSGIFGLIGSVLKGIAGVVLAPATGGASLLLTAGAVAEGIGHVGNIAAGSAQEKAYEEEAQREFDALPEDIQAMIVAQQAGIPLAAAAGALMGAAGGSRDDVALVQQSVQGAFSVGLDIAIAKAQAELQAAEATRQREERELAIQERQNRLDELRARLDADTEGFSQENYLADLLDVARQQYDQLVQEGKQLGELTNALAPKNQSVLMQIGGSSWGDGTGGPSLADMSAGFGGLTAGMVDPWSSLSVENGWGNAAKGRMIAPWDAGEEATGGWGDVVPGLPDTPVQGASEVMGAAGSAADAEYIGGIVRAVVQAMGGSLTAGTTVQTQFTGDVTIDGRRAQDTIDALAEELARAH